LQEQGKQPYDLLVVKEEEVEKARRGAPGSQEEGEHF
jgi:hypothetical protein